MFPLVTGSCEHRIAAPGRAYQRLPTGSRSGFAPHARRHQPERYCRASATRCLGPSPVMPEEQTDGRGSRDPLPAGFWIQVHGSGDHLPASLITCSDLRKQLLPQAIGPRSIATLSRRPARGGDKTRPAGQPLTNPPTAVGRVVDLAQLRPAGSRRGELRVGTAVYGDKRASPARTAAWMDAARPDSGADSVSAVTWAKPAVIRRSA